MIDVMMKKRLSTLSSPVEPDVLEVYACPITNTIRFFSTLLLCVQTQQHKQPVHVIFVVCRPSAGPPTTPGPLLCKSLQTNSTPVCLAEQHRIFPEMPFPDWEIVGIIAG